MITDAEKEAGLLDTREACRYAGITRRTLTRWLASGRVKAVQITNRNYYRPADLDAARASHQGMQGITLHLTRPEADDLLTALDAGNAIDNDLADQLTDQIQAQITDDQEQPPGGHSL